MPTPKTLTDHDIQRLRRGRLRQAVEASVEDGAERGLVPEMLARLVGSIPKHVTPEVGLLVWACCRWGEITTLEIEDVQQEGQGWIWMSKVGSWRSTPRVSEEVQAQWKAVDPSVIVPYQSRRRVSDWIRRTLRERGIGTPRGILQGTHLIRHLTASVMSWQGTGRKEIARRLGHEDEATTAEYIHTKAAWQPA